MFKAIKCWWLKRFYKPELSNNITVYVFKEQFVNAKTYCSVKGCPLALALQKMFPRLLISVGGTFCYINHVQYDFDLNTWGIQFIEDRMRDHKADKDIPGYDIVKLIRKEI